MVVIAGARVAGMGVRERVRDGTKKWQWLVAPYLLLIVKPCGLIPSRLCIAG